MSSLEKIADPASRVLPAVSIVALWAVIATLALAGCRDRLDDHTALRLSNPETRHPIKFSARRETLEVEVAGSGEGLSASQEADVYRFIDRYRAEAQGPIVISLPAGGSSRPAARRTAEQIRRMIAEAEIPRRAVVSERHASEKNFGAAVQIAYERPVAIPPTCGDFSVDLGVDRERVHYPDFGCATQRNHAVMVANPRDLIHPQEEDPRSAERRSVVWGQYTAPVAGGGGAAAPAGGSGDSSSKAKPAAIK